MASRLSRNLKTAKATIDDLIATKAGPDLRKQMTDVQRRLGDALLSIDDLERALFELQEQNQQLRRDLSDRVCPRLCASGRRSAS